MPEPERRRRRPAVSCLLCRRRKIRCNREIPCSNCIRSKNESCVYENQAPLQGAPPRIRPGYSQAVGQYVDLEVRGDPSSGLSTERMSIVGNGGASTVPGHAPQPRATDSIGSSNFAGSTPASDIVHMRNWILQLEDQLSKAHQRPPASPAPTPRSNIETTTSQIAGTYHVAREPPGEFQRYTITRGVMHKSRLFGQSHWAHGAALFKDIFEMIEPHVREETSRASTGLKRCKALARVIKAQRAPAWPTAPTTDLPPKALADELVDCYLRTIETVYRILHIPSFRSEYEGLWVSNSVPEMPFVIQLKLVLAIGATMYDDRFSMRESAVKWVYEAQTWVSEPEYKSRLNIQCLQIEILLLMAREATALGSDIVWTAAGDLLRKAVYMGLHRDPLHLPKRTIFAAEMRRRLWNTILELTLQSSLISGGPPFISSEDFDTDSPGNFNDDQLLEGDPVPRSEDVFTQTSTSILLRRSFPYRLAVNKFLNDLGSQGTDEECLRLDRLLRESYRGVCRTLRGYQREGGPTPSAFAIRVLEFLNYRYLSSVHLPFFGPSLIEARYAFSRKVMIESSLKLWCTAYPSSSIMASQPGREPVPSTADDLARHTTCASGFFRKAIMQALLFIVAELRTQIQEEESLGPSPYRLDLLSVLGDSEKWAWDCMEAGETNIKGYLFFRLITSQIQGLMRGLEKDEIAELLVRATEEAEDKCLALFEPKAAQGRSGDTETSPSQLFLDMPSGMLEDWGFIMSDAFFDFGGTEPMSWGL